MNFFEHQELSRKKSLLLIMLFSVGIVAIVLAVNIAVAVILHYSGIETLATDNHFSWPDSNRFLWVSVATLVLIFGAGMLKVRSLKQGGAYVAESLGGRPVDPSTSDPGERRLINVVEEMAIASGIPVPMVFLLDNEPGINAFAAGYTFDDAVVGVTRGCLEQLDRDELQGVVAHEFSHILNGDMRLNIRLVGLISGILVLAVLGRMFLRSSRGGNRSKGNAAIVMIGVALILIGYIGVLISRMIQSAVSRQREYLSDASAVQFTRNPNGIANALKKIGGFHAGSAIASPQALETSHMFFGSALNTIFSTHPPIANRIQRIDSSFKATVSGLPKETFMENPFVSEISNAMNREQKRPLVPGRVMNRVGLMSPENIAYSADIMSAIPADLRDDLRDPLGASCVIYTLLLDVDPEQKQNQIAVLQPIASKHIVQSMNRLEKTVGGLDPELKLSVLDLSIPALRRLSTEQYSRFKKHVTALVAADNKISLFEFFVQEIIIHRLDVAFHPRAEKETYRSIERLVDDAAVIIAKLAVTGHVNPGEARAAFGMGMRRIPVPWLSTDPLQELEDVTLADVGRAIKKFNASRPAVKGILLDACAHCILFDRVVTAAESEMLRAVAYALDLPVPPFLVQAPRS